MQGQLSKAAQEWASLFTNLQWQKVGRVAPKWLTFALVILVAKSAADLTWLIFTPKEQGKTSTRTYQSAKVAQTSQARLRTLTDLHLFGIAAKKAATVEAPIEATETKLNLTLRGVFAADNPAQAMAIIADAKGEEKVYRKGETIFSGVTLYQVYPDRVILERSGTFETLSLPRDKDTAKSGGPRVVRPAAYTPPQTMDTEAAVRTRTVQGGKELEALREQLTNNPEEFWKNVRIEPVYDSDKQIIGYRFEHNDRQMMQALGLRPGDVIVEINGQPVTDPSVLSGLMGQLATATSLSLGIQRNGQRENLNINM